MVRFKAICKRYFADNGELPHRDTYKWWIEKGEQVGYSAIMDINYGGLLVTSTTVFYGGRKKHTLTIKAKRRK